jgi:hypothetical protein
MNFSAASYYRSGGSTDPGKSFALKADSPGFAGGQEQKRAKEFAMSVQVSRKPSPFEGMP